VYTGYSVGFTKFEGVQVHQYLLINVNQY